MAAIPACEKEKEVGIHRYLSSPEVCPGFSAVFKHRFTDFVVREVDLSERVAKLTDLVEYEAPEKKSEGENDGRNGAAAAAVADAPARTWIEEEEAMKELQTAIGAEDAARFADFVKLKTEAKDKTEDEHLVLTPNDDKDKRTAVHKFFKARQHLVPLISTDTLVKDETKSVSGRKRFEATTKTARKGWAWWNIEACHRTIELTDSIWNAFEPLKTFFCFIFLHPTSHCHRFVSLF